MTSINARRLGWLLLYASFVLLGHVRHTLAQQAFADTCACPDPAPCPSFCLDCDSYDSDCTSGKTQGYCNGEGHEVCPTNYIKKTQQEVDPGGSVWSCTGGGSRRTMYHCFRFCLGITTGQCNKCQDGYYGFNNDQTCALCEAGSYCANGILVGDCDAGHYCESGASVATQNLCPPGTYGDVTGLKTSQCAGFCSAGYYCESGSTDPNQYPCDAGSWGSLGQTGRTCSGQCTAGYYCPLASSSSKAFVCGNAGRYCVEGAATFTVVQTGFYSTPTTGDADKRTGEQVCPQGAYCENGVLITCPAGEYSSSLGATSCAGLCSAGFYCPAGSKSPNANPCYPDPLNPPTYPAKYYCPAGTSAPLTVLDGYYTTPESAPENQRYSQAFADPVLYTTRNGRRYRKVAWEAACVGDSGSLDVNEFTNGGVGVGGENGALITTFSAFDNILDEQVTLFELLDLNAALTSDACTDFLVPGASPFELITDSGTNISTLHVKADTFIDYEECPSFVLEIVATSGSGTNDSATCQLTLDIINLNDRPFFLPRTEALYPLDPPPITTFSVKERTVRNEGVGSPIMVDDEDVGQEIYFEILDTLDGVLNTFYIGSCSGQLYVQQETLDYGIKQRYDLQIRACDDPKFFGSGNASCTDITDIIVNVEDINDPPTFTLTPEIAYFAVPENSAKYTALDPWCFPTGTSSSDASPPPYYERCEDIVAGYTGFTVDDWDVPASGSSTTDIMTFTITRNDDDSFYVASCSRTNNLDLCALPDSAGTAKAGTMFLVGDTNYETNQRYSITVRVNDGRGLEDAKEFDIHVLDANDPPDWDTSITTVRVDENDASDSVLIAAADEDAIANITYSVVSVKDDAGADMVSVPLLFEIGSPSWALAGSDVSMYLTRAVDYEVSHFYSVVVEAMDQFGATSQGTITVEVRDVNEAPVLVTAILYVPENLPFGTVLDELLQVSDPDNADGEDIQRAFFSLAASSSPEFTVQTQGNITTQVPLNFEDYVNYTLAVLVTDTGTPSIEVSGEVIIVVTDEPEPPTIEAGQEFQFTELQEVYDNETMSLPDWNRTIVAYDDDVGDTLTLEILEQIVMGTDIAVNYFAVSGTMLLLNAEAGKVPRYASMEFDDQKKFVIKLRGVDQSGLESEQNVVVEVLDDNNRPIMTAASYTISQHNVGNVPCTMEEYCQPGSFVGNLFALCVDEDVRTDALATDITYTILSGNDGDTFEVSNGRLMVKTISTELKTKTHVFSLQVQATDHDVADPLSSVPVTITVTVAEVNKKPQASDQSVTISEDDDSVGGGVAQDRERVLIEDLGATDPEETELVYEIINISPYAARNVFALNSNGTLSAIQSVDFEIMNAGDAVIDVEVTDGGGVGNNTQSTTFRVTVTVLDVNETPTLADTLLTLPENSASGIVPGIVSLGNDPDAADDGALTYTLLTASTQFTIDSSNAKISQDGSLDYESPVSPCVLQAGLHVCEFQVQVEDTEGHTATATTKIIVSNENEAPQLGLPTCIASVSSCVSQTVIVAEDVVTAVTGSGAAVANEVRVAKFSAQEPDGFGGIKSSFASYSFVLPDGEPTATGGSALYPFRLDATGNLYITDALNYENVSMYQVNVQVNDEGSPPLSDSFLLSVNVTNVNDIGVVSVPSNGPWDTFGGEALVLIGSNFGPTASKLANESWAMFNPVRVFLGTEAGLLADTPEFEATGCTIDSYSQISCTGTPAGVGTNYYWQVSIEQDAGLSPAHKSTLNTAELTSFKQPEITDIIGITALPTTGEAMIRVLGDNFGPLATAVSATYRVSYETALVFTTTTCSVTSASVEMECESIPGIGAGLEFSVSVGGQSSPWISAPSVSSNVFSHAAPTVTNVFLTSGASKLKTDGDAADRLVLEGTNFGLASLVESSNTGVQVTYGPTGAYQLFAAKSCVVVIDHTRIECVYVAGVGENLSFAVTVASIRSPQSTGKMSYFGPVVFNMAGAGAENAATQGGDAVILTGQNFGPVTTSPSTNLRVFYGGPNADKYEAQGCIVVTTQTTIQCTTASGTGRGHAWRVLISGQESPTSFGGDDLGTSYAPPTVNRFLGDAAKAAKTIGGESVILDGVNFGDGRMPVFASFGPTGSEFEAVGCAVDASKKHTRVTCTLPEGVGRTLRWVITVDGQSSQVPTTAYRIPEITNVTAVNGNALQTISTAGGEQFALHGTDFGTSDVVDMLDGVLEVEYGPITGHEFMARNCTVVSDDPSEVWCKFSQGAGAAHHFVVTTLGQKSALSGVTMSYSPPSIGVIDPAVGETSPNMVLSVNGSNFGPEDVAKVTWNGLPLSILTRTHTHLTLAIPEALQRGSNNALKIDVAGQVVSSSYAFGRPTVASISAVYPPLNFTGQTPQGILIRGSNFGSFVVGDSAVTIDSSPCVVIEWNHAYIACNATKLTGPLKVNVGGQDCRLSTDPVSGGPGCCPCDFDYSLLLKPPKLNYISKCDTPGVAGGECSTAGGYQIVVFGEDLGAPQFGRVEIGGMPCEVAGGALNYTDTKVTCTVPPGEGQASVTVYQAWKQTEELVMFHYDPPNIVLVAPERGPTEGGIRVSVVGSNFGVNGPDLMFGDTLLELDYFDHSLIQFTLPPGQGVNEMSVNVSGQAHADGSIYFDYFVANVSSASPEKGSTKGQYPVEIYGSNFGTNGTVMVGTQVCPIVSYNHTRIVCTMPAGGGDNLEIIIYSGGRRSAYSGVTFTYNRPILHQVTPNHGPTAGGELIALVGENFGVGMTVTIGTETCGNVVVISDTSAECELAPGVGVSYPVVATLSGQESRQVVMFNYDAPILSRWFPDPADANGGRVDVFGLNFGSDTTDPGGAFDVEVTIGEVSCNNASRVDDLQIFCDMPAVKVGWHNTNVSVAGQFASEAHDLFAVCSAGAFGRPGEMCSECPSGAHCRGFVGNTHHDPSSLPGHGSVSRTAFQLCNPRIACLGDDRCTMGYMHADNGENLCQMCFRGNATHEVGYYRLEGLCVECPRLAWLLLVGVFVAAAFLCGAAYLLTKNGVQLAAVSIAIDFAQVCSLFASYDFAWPSLVMGAYATLSAFNLNLELASPECSVGWDYQTKWQIMFFMPAMFAAVFAASVIYNFIKTQVKKAIRSIKEALGYGDRDAIKKRLRAKRRRKRERKAQAKANKAGKNALQASAGSLDIDNDSEEEDDVDMLADGNSEDEYDDDGVDEKRLLVDDDDVDDYDASFNKVIDAEFGAFLIMCYYLYLSVMKKVFEIFTCENGSLKSEASIKCSSDDPVYRRLYGLSLLGLFIYGIGVPGGIATLLFRHRVLIKRDQHRREASMGERKAATMLQNLWRGYHVRRMLNPVAILKRHKLLANIGRTRAKFGKMYEDFTGDCFYWRLILLARKLLLVIISMFGEEKYQQTCLAFAVLFISYALQVKHRPYLARYQTKNKMTGALSRKLSRAPRGFSKINQFIAKRDANNEAGGGRFATMDSRLFEINRNAVKRILGKKKDATTDVTLFNENDPQALVAKAKKEAEEKFAENRWMKVRKFVTDSSDDKFVLKSETALEMGEDMFRWLFDYNSLEALSLGTSMYVLLFGMLFDSYDASGEDLKTDFLAAMVMGLVTVVIAIFMASVGIDVYRKFIVGSKLLRRLPFRNKVAPDDKEKSMKLATDKKKGKRLKNPQWFPPVNPFATLQSQNADLIRAEEARIAAILARKMKHLQELHERETIRQEEQDRLEKEHAERMRLWEEQARLDDEQTRLEQEELEQEMERAAEEQQRLIDEELQSKLAAIERSDAMEPIMEEDAEEEQEILDHEAEIAFELEKEVLLAEETARAEAEKAKMREEQQAELDKAIAGLESEAGETFVGHREHQEELKARMWEIMARKPRRKRNKPKVEPGVDEAPMLDAIDALSGKLERLVAEQDAKLESLDHQHEETQTFKLEALRSMVKRAVLQEHQADKEFENEVHQEFDDLEEAALREGNERKKSLAVTLGAEGAAGEEERAALKAKFDEVEAQMKAAMDEKKRVLQLAVERRRNKRLAAMQNKAVEEAERRAAAVEAAEAETTKAMEAQRAVVIAQTSGGGQDVTEDGEAVNEASEVRDKFEKHMKSVEEKTLKNKELRRVALQRRLEARRQSIARTAQFQNKKKERKKTLVALQLGGLGAIGEGGPAAAGGGFPGGAPAGLPAINEKSEKEVEAQLVKIRAAAELQRDQLERKLADNKRLQREKLKERLLKRKSMAESKKAELLREKKRSEEESARKRKEEEAKIRERHDKEIKDIEGARIEVLLDDSHAQSLADGVKEWRKRRDGEGEGGAAGGKAGGHRGSVAPPRMRRSSVLRQAFGGKVRKLEEMVAEARATQMAEVRRREKFPDSEPTAVEATIASLQDEVRKHVNELNGLYKSYEEEVETEINKLANEAAVEKARQRRKIEMLQGFANPPKTPGGPGAASRLPGGIALTPPLMQLPGAAMAQSRAAGIPGVPAPPAPGSPIVPVMHVDLAGLSLRKFGDL